MFSKVREKRRSFQLLLICMTLSMAFLIVGCGSSASGQGGQAQNTPTVSHQVQNCGTLHSTRLLIVPADQINAKKDETCFAQAYQKCQPAILVYSQNDLDSGLIHNFALKNSNGKCTILDGVQHYIAPRPPLAATTFTCRDLAMQDDGLHVFSCGDAGNVVVPIGS